MYLFLVPLVFGFACNVASVFTTTFSHWWGERIGSLVTVVLRDILGIPIWAIGFVLAVHASSPVLFVSTVVTDVVGWSIIATGGVIILLALIDIRWRAAMPSMRDKLVQIGLYAYVRHPIHSGTFLEFIGLVFLMPLQTVGIACVLGGVWILVQTRCEEIDLLQRMPGYRGYMNSVPCFLPRFRAKLKK
jgi:protein-S-isoprenylcysteine O-methyltransferase Ste14